MGAFMLRTLALLGDGLLVTLGVITVYAGIHDKSRPECTSYPTGVFLEFDVEFLTTGQYVSRYRFTRDSCFTDRFGGVSFVFWVSWSYWNNDESEVDPYDL